MSSNLMPTFESFLNYLFSILVLQMNLFAVLLLKYICPDLESFRNFRFFPSLATSFPPALNSNYLGKYLCKWSSLTSNRNGNKLNNWNLNIGLVETSKNEPSWNNIPSFGLLSIYYNGSFQTLLHSVTIIHLHVWLGPPVQLLCRLCYRYWYEMH